MTVPTPDPEAHDALPEHLEGLFGLAQALSPDAESAIDLTVAAIHRVRQQEGPPPAIPWKAPSTIPRKVPSP